MLAIGNLPQPVRIGLIRGATYSFNVNWPGGTNLSGSTFSLVVRVEGSATALVTLSLGSGISVASNVATVTFSSAQTTALAAGSYVYLMTHTVSGVVTPIMSGTLDARSEVAA